MGEYRDSAETHGTINRNDLPDAHRIEFLTMLGLFGVVIDAIQALATGSFKSEAEGGIHWDISIVGLLIIFVVALNGMYHLTAVFLQHCDAAIFNLSTYEKEKKRR